MSREAKLNLFGKLVYETIQRCRKKAKIRKEMEEKSRLTCNCTHSRGCGLLKSSTTAGVTWCEVTITQTSLGRFKLI